MPVSRWVRLFTVRQKIAHSPRSSAKESYSFRRFAVMGTRSAFAMRTIGVRARPPFVAHAWAEAEGRMVGEDAAPPTSAGSAPSRPREAADAVPRAPARGTSVPGRRRRRA
ncbi:hypothetical protein ACH4PU_34645 [Streptomyces sp. NPDC021100]|uniref:hypothetical protein n=1 Tax=Streptomyces sp. NPDC021100 TaxID=3365114 RepID=UPI0037B3B6B1